MKFLVVPGKMTMPKPVETLTVFLLSWNFWLMQHLFLFSLAKAEVTWRYSGFYIDHSSQTCERDIGANVQGDSLPITVLSS